MKPIAYVITDFTNVYNDYSLISRITDRLKIHLTGKDYIKELDLDIMKIYLPPNINQIAYSNNIKKIKKYSRKKDIAVAPKTYRLLDYNIYNDFQKNLLGFTVVNSSKLVLRTFKKSIRDSCIVLYDSSSVLCERILDYLAREARYVILISNNRSKLKKLQEYVSANYGISVITTSEINSVLKIADMIITTKDIVVDGDIPIWYLDNLYRPEKKKRYAINDVSYKVPWDINLKNLPMELVGAVLSQMGEKDVEKSLNSNEIFINNVVFNVDPYIHCN